jgi:hypothetical protein
VSAYFASGRAVDVVLLVILAEFAVLAFRARRRASGGGVIDAALALLPGVFMLLALRAALTGAGWPLIALLLAASFPVHLLDLVRRKL